MTAHDSCTIRELVGGSIAVPSDELPSVLTDSDTGQSLYAQRASGADSVEEAIAVASAVHATGAWSELPPKERAACLRTFQAELLARVDDLARADSLDTGVLLTTTTAFLGGVTGLLELAAVQVEEGFGHSETTSSAGPCDQWRLPWGPAAVFLPWNAPANMAVVRVSDALVAGCPVVLKPSEWAPHFSGPFADAVLAALPPGVIQILHGGADVGQSIVADERIAAVSFTGGVAGGRAVAEACATQLKPVDLELSGNNPVVVLPGEDPGAVVGEVVTAMLTLNGQYCVGPRRLIVPQDEVDAYLAALATALDGVVIGATTDPTTQLGPLASEPHLRHIDAQLEAFASRGCEVRRHGQPPTSPGHFTAPAVVMADKAADLKEEVFGPVLLVRTYEDLEEAITIANDHPYGLGGYVFGTDRDAARSVGRRLRAGLVRLNSAYGPPDAAPVCSVWGISGLGTFGVGEGVQFFSGARFVG